VLKRKYKHKMKQKIFFIISFFFQLNASFGQVIDDSEKYRQQEIICYNQILETLIQTSITWWGPCIIPAPPLPLEALEQPTKLDSANYHQKISIYKKEINEYESSKITTFHISDSLFTLNSFSNINHDSCVLNNKMNYLNTRFITSFDNLIKDTNAENLKFESNYDVNLELILSRIYFDKNFLSGTFFVRTIDLFGHETTRCISVVFKSSIWEIEQ